jgi:CarD family transcriptional regulator
MVFHIGDKVIHWTYGLGEIVDIEEKIIDGNPTNCYVVHALDTMIWIPINDLEQRSLRMPTSPEEFEGLFGILTSPGEKLQEDRVLRKNKLMAQLKDGKLASTCEVVRDLTYFKRSSKLSDLERALLERAIKSLIAEWSYSLGMSIGQAEEAMATLLETSIPAAAPTA